MSRQSSWASPGALAGLVLLLAVVLVYQPVGHAGYLWDDNVLLTANPCIVGPLGFKEIWTTRAADICPLTITAFWVEHKLWGLAPVPYHLVSVLLHGVGALLFWRVLRALQVPGAWLGAALWALHPVQVESVAWISEMKNTQSGVFYLLAILCFLHAHRAGDHGVRGRVWLRAGAVLCAALAMASKTSAMVLPVVLCLLAWWQEGRWRWRTLLQTGPIFLLAIAAGVLSVGAQALHPVAGPGFPAVQSWPQRLAITGDAVWFYLGKLAWPHPLIMVYPRWEVDPGHWSAFLPLLAVLVALLVLWRQRRAWTSAGLLAFACFVVVLLPVLGLVEISYFRYSFVADHFQYLASMGPLALAGAGVARLRPASLPTGQGWRSAVGGALLLILGLASWQRVWAYESQQTLWSDTLAKNPHCGIGHESLGIALREKGRLDEALAELREALKINPDNADAHGNLGAALTEKGRLDEALAELREALKINPDNADAHYNLGVVFFQKEQLDEAIVQYQEVLKIDPRYALAHRSIGAALLKKGQVDAAIVQYQEALRINPGFALAHRNLGAALLQKGPVDAAIGQYQEALQVDPDNANTHYDLGNLFLQKRQVDAAIGQYQEAMAIDSNYAPLHTNLGLAFLQKGQVDAAIGQCQEALKLAPDEASVHRGLGVVLARRGRVDEAITQFQEALRLKPEYGEARHDLATVQAMARPAAGGH